MGDRWFIMRNSKKIADAILAINPDAQVAVNKDDIDNISWINDTPVIPKEDIEAKMVELQAEYDGNQYQRNRTVRSENGGYPTIGDQLDMIYHDQVDGTTTFKDAIKAIKDAIPKP